MSAPLAAVALAAMRQLALAALILAALPGLAHAEIGESTITSPANPTYRLFEPERTRAEPELRIEATTDGANQEKVDVICSYGDTHDVLVENEPVDAEGRVEVDVALGRFPVALCDLRVVPAGHRGPDLSSFTGPVVSASHHIPRTNEVPVRGSDEPAALGYLVAGGQRRAAVIVASAGDGGLFAAPGREGARTRAVRLHDLARGRRRRGAYGRPAGRVHQRRHPALLLRRP